jgi:hypothetical protein
VHRNETQCPNSRRKLPRRPLFWSLHVILIQFEQLVIWDASMMIDCDGERIVCRADREAINELRALPVVRFGGITRSAGKRSCAEFIEFFCSVGPLSPGAPYISIAWSNTRFILALFWLPLSLGCLFRLFRNVHHRGF